jgi:hypothetical protein
MTLMPDADVREVILALAGDLAMVPWAKRRVPASPRAFGDWQQALGPAPLEELQDVVHRASHAEHEHEAEAEAENEAAVEDLAAVAREAGIRVRHGINGRAHPLAIFGGPGAFSPDVWSTFTHPGTEQRIRRLRPPRTARPQPRSPPDRHQERHPHQPGPPA